MGLRPYPGAPLRRRKLTRQMAVALGYEHGKRAPEVLARGAGLLAERIIALARSAGVPVRQDADLTEVLAGLEIGAEIPPELYEAVAEVLAFVYKMNAGYRQAAGGRRPRSAKPGFATQGEAE